MIVLGFAMLAGHACRTAAAVGVLLGALFVAAGAGRLYLLQEEVG